MSREDRTQKEKRLPHAPARRRPLRTKPPHAMGQRRIMLATNKNQFATIATRKKAAFSQTDRQSQTWPPTSATPTTTVHTTTDATVLTATTVHTNNSAYLHKGLPTRDTFSSRWQRLRGCNTTSPEQEGRHRFSHLRPTASASFTPKRPPPPPTTTRSPPVPPATTCSLSATNACLQHLRPLQQAQGHQRFPYLYGRFQLKGQQRFPPLRPSPPKSSSAVSTPSPP